MRSDRLVTVAKYATATEAQLARNLLTAAGIDSSLGGTNSADMLNYVGSALGGVRLEVREADYEQAVEVLFADEAGADAAELPAGDWNCPQCGEFVEETFQVCWSCGATRTGTTDPEFASARESDDEPADEPVAAVTPPAAEQANASARGWLCDECEQENLPGVNICASCGARSPELKNPFYTSSGDLHASGGVDGSTGATEEELEACEATLRRAWNAAILGLVFLPVILTLYSTLLLLSVTASDVTLPPRSMRRYRNAWLINILVMAVAGLFLSWILL